MIQFFTRLVDNRRSDELCWMFWGEPLLWLSAIWGGFLFLAHGLIEADGLLLEGGFVGRDFERGAVGDVDTGKGFGNPEGVPFSADAPEAAELNVHWDDLHAGALGEVENAGGELVVRSARAVGRNGDVTPFAEMAGDFEQGDSTTAGARTPDRAHPKSAGDGSEPAAIFARTGEDADRNGSTTACAVVAEDTAEQSIVPNAEDQRVFASRSVKAGLILPANAQGPGQ